MKKTDKLQQKERINQNLETCLNYDFSMFEKEYRNIVNLKLVPVFTKFLSEVNGIYYVYNKRFKELSSCYFVGDNKEFNVLRLYIFSLINSNDYFVFEKATTRLDLYTYDNNTLLLSEKSDQIKIQEQHVNYDNPLVHWSDINITEPKLNINKEFKNLPTFFHKGDILSSWFDNYYVFRNNILLYEVKEFLHLDKDEEGEYVEAFLVSARIDLLNSLMNDKEITILIPLNNLYELNNGTVQKK